MARRLPSLNAVRAFEAAGRHLSFTRAAEELNVTQAAVSHQIKALEESLGQPLFRRLNRALRLTEAGQQLLPYCSDAFDLLVEGLEKLRKRDESGPLNIATTDTFAAIWLLPRLHRFRDRHPEIDARISTTDELLDYAREGIDLGIRHGRGNWPELETHCLMRETVFPVCAPDLLHTGPGLRNPEDLAHYPILHDDLPEQWEDWLEAVGAAHLDVSRGLRFTHSYLVLQAARAGQGIAMGRSALVLDDLAQGTLVRPFDAELPAANSFWLAAQPEDWHRPKVKAFREWLIEEAEGLIAITPEDL